MQLDKYEKEDISKQFSILKEKYEKLGVNLVQAIELFLKENDINFLSISYRVKDEKSFLEKIDRKNYGNPFNQTEDLCGIRIICYYQSDVNKIISILEKEVVVLENQDKEELLDEDQFGYRSTHLIVKIKENWLNTPNYRGLNNVKAEIQIRTVLMHAWAEIQHKLAYKKEAHIPRQFKRKFNMISAKLEEADGQFEEIKNSIDTYKNEVQERSKSTNLGYSNIELNLDSLQAFLDDRFPDRSKNIDSTRVLLDEFIKFGITLPDLDKAYNIVKPYFQEIEKDIFMEEGFVRGWAQVGIARNMVSLTSNSYYKIKSKIVPSRNKEILDKWRGIIVDRF